MSSDFKVFAPDATWSITGNATLAGTQIVVSAASSYSDDFSVGYTVGAVPTGWIWKGASHTASATVVNTGGAYSWRMPEDGGAYYGSATFSDGMFVGYLRNYGGKRGYVGQRYSTSADGRAYAEFFYPGSADTLHYSVTTALVPAGTPSITRAGLGTVEPASTTMRIGLQCHTNGSGIVVLRTFYENNMKSETISLTRNWSAGYLLIGTSSYSGTDSYWSSCRFYPVRSGSFEKTFTAATMSKVNKISVDYQNTGAYKKSYSAVFEYSLDGGAWTALPDTGLIALTASATVAVRSNDTLKNDFRSDTDVRVGSVAIDIEGTWGAGDVPSPATAFTASTLSYNSVRLNWTDALTANYYQVFRNTGSTFSSASIIGMKSQGFGQYDDIGLADETAYYYWLVSLVTSGASSVEVSAGPVTTPTASTVNLITIRDSLISLLSANSALINDGLERSITAFRAGRPEHGVHTSALPCVFVAMDEYDEEVNSLGNIAARDNEQTINIWPVTVQGIGETLGGGQAKAEDEANLVTQNICNLLRKKPDLSGTVDYVSGLSVTYNEEFGEGSTYVKANKIALRCFKLIH